MAKAKILICEDDGIIAIHIRNSLVDLGYHVVTIVTSAEEAISTALEYSPDLVLMDIRLNGRTDGIEAAERIRQQMDIPIIYLTAYADEATLRRAKITEPHGYLLKPFEDEDLRVTIEIALNRHAAERKVRARERHLALLNDITQSALATPDLVAFLQLLTNRLKELIHNDACYIALWDEALQMPTLSAASGEMHQKIAHLQAEPGEASLTAAVMQAGSAICVNDASNSSIISPRLAGLLASRSLLGLPLIAGDERLGALLFGFEESHEFSAEEIALGQQAADLAALAIARLRSLEETRKRNEELGALARVSSAMRVARKRAEIPPVVLEQLLALFQADSAALIHPEAARGAVIFETATGLWVRHSGSTFVTNLSPESLDGVMNQPYLNNDVPGLVQTLGLAHTPDVQCVAGVPLIADGHVTGGLWIGRNAPIGQNELNLLSSIGNIVANAIYRSELHEDLELQYKALQKAQLQLVQSEKLAAVGELVAGVAHELNNPLTAVVLYAQILQVQLSNPDLSKDLDKIVTEAQRASRIVRGLLEFARQRPVERKPVQVNNVLHNALELLTYQLHTYNIRVETSYDPDLPYTLADRHQLQQVFLNVITNAWQAMREQGGERGQLLVETQLGPALFGGMAAPGEEPVIHIQIKDNGPGIPPEFISNIFDPFFTTKQPGQGTGLGLSICHGIISEHGGHIWAESEPGRGTTFFIELPVNEPDTELHISGMPLFPAEAEALVRDTRVLVVDDEPNVLTIMKRALERGGYQVDAAPDGQAGLRALEQNRYDLIVCDIRMPEMSGPQFYRLLELHYPQMTRRIIFTTGDSVSPDTRRFLEQTGLTHLSKPFELDDLIYQVSAACRVDVHLQATLRAE
ncbi:MAG: response regulator [Chloroflexota bacterium]